MQVGHRGQGRRRHAIGDKRSVPRHKVMSRRTADRLEKAAEVRVRQEGRRQCRDWWKD